MIIFGASKAGQLAYWTLKDLGEVIGFCDNDGSKWGTTMDGIKIISPSELYNLCSKNKEVEVIISSSYSKEIALQLQDRNIPCSIFNSK
jgi:FlaA1/EpsC-like NDP-sugar epimerase